jgi:hypothetical protein
MIELVLRLYEWYLEILGLRLSGEATERQQPEISLAGYSWTGQQLVR